MNIHWTKRKHLHTICFRKKSPIEHRNLFLWFVVLYSETITFNFLIQNPKRRLCLMKKFLLIFCFDGRDCLGTTNSEVNKTATWMEAYVATFTEVWKKSKVVNEKTLKANGFRHILTKMGKTSGNQV